MCSYFISRKFKNLAELFVSSLSIIEQTYYLFVQFTVQLLLIVHENVILHLIGSTTQGDS